MALFEVIKKNKEDNNIVWRYPKRNFNTGSKLIVNESEEALLYSMGKALDLFGPGKYTLSTNNIPLLRNIVNIPTGFRTPFTCEVYFIDKSIKQFKWGTPTKLEFLEPMYNFPISIGACGEIRFQVEDARKLLVKLVGIKKKFDAENIDDFFTSEILVKVKSYLTNIIKKDKISIFEIDSKLDVISGELKNLLEKDFLEYGIKLEKFFLTNIAKPEEDRQYLKFKELYFKQGVLTADAIAEKQLGIIESEKEAAQTKIEAEALAEKRKIEGYTYHEEKGFDIGKTAAGNEGVGEFANVGVGLGIMSGIGTTMGSQVSNQVAGAFAGIETLTCKYCGVANSEGTKFCKHCGKPFEVQSLFCPNCGNTIEHDAVFCSKCGKKVN